MTADEIGKATLDSTYTVIYHLRTGNEYRLFGAGEMKVLGKWVACAFYSTRSSPVHTYCRAKDDFAGFSSSKPNAN